MSPLQLSILLHYYGSGEDFRGGDFSAPAVREAIDCFRDEAGMLMQDEETFGKTYKLTPKGKFFVDHLLATPFPEIQWIIPERASR